MFITIVSIFGTGVLGIFGYVFQRAVILGNRVTALETRQEDLPALLTSQFQGVNQRLDRIERSMNGYLSRD